MDKFEEFSQWVDKYITTDEATVDLYSRIKDDYYEASIRKTSLLELMNKLLLMGNRFWELYPPKNELRSNFDPCACGCIRGTHMKERIYKYPEEDRFLSPDYEDTWCRRCIGECIQFEPDNLAWILKNKA